ncbi:MAG: hypothetical protein K5664_04255 [Firmicutes bacterium]|nr:hypothetical protein [Bacillota bacterium]
MLNPNNDRLDYGQILAPPSNYKLDFAIGTTYSLDLDALVGACIALGLSEETDSKLVNNPICLLEALRATGDKIALFCEGGQIHMPNKVTSLYILLEKMVFPVTTAKTRGISRFPSFHPKFWLIRYIDDKGDFLYRVVVLSRNLTFDRSWDVTFCMDGIKTSEETNKNNPVSDFLAYLIKQLPTDDYVKEKQKKIRSISRELKNVQFKLDSKEFFDFDFIPVGIKSAEDNCRFYMEKYSLFRDSFHEVLIISPFVSNGVIKDFNERAKHIERPKHVLITRSSELGKLKPADCSNFKIYTMKDAVVDGESAISEETESVQKQDIHAKVYMIRKYSDSELYLGSLNASHNALYGNIEFMIILYSKNRYLNLAKLTESLFGTEEAESPFQEVTLQDKQVIDEEQEKLNMLDSYIKDINRLSPTARITPNGELYDVSVCFGEFDPKYQVFVSPLLSNKTAPIEKNILFTSLEITQLSEFYKISVSDGTRTVTRIIIIPTEGMPDDREKAVVSNVVNDRDCFYRYIAFLLGDSYILSALESNQNNSDGTYKANALRSIKIPALYEKMLQTAAASPERFKEIDYLIKSVSADGVIPKDFEKLYNTFKKAVKL